MLFFAAIGAFILGALLFWKSEKTRKEGEDWSNSLQWGYLLMMIGAFGLLAKFMSFTAVLLCFVLGTGLIWVYDKVVRRKNKKIKQAMAQSSATEAVQSAHEVKEVGHFVDYMRGFFPIILIVFVLRTFVAEPFQIPSGSMRPGLIVGDFILVQKYAYGVRMPITNKVLIPTKPVERGDVAVFNYPVQPEVNYIKRIIGVSGDTVEYRNKVLTVNGQIVADTALQVSEAERSYVEQGMLFPDNNVFEESLNNKAFRIFQNPEAPTLSLGHVGNFPFRENCTYDTDGFICKVPQGHYFAMGDNRDNSGDSRYWGFVPDQYMVGRAFLIWMNFSDLSRIGKAIN